MISQSYHMASEDLKCSMWFVWTTCLILYEAWKPQSSKEGPVRFFKILFVCVCVPKKKESHTNGTTRRWVRTLFPFSFNWTIPFKTFWLVYTSHSNSIIFVLLLLFYKTFILHIFNWIHRVIVSFNHCIWFPWVCCFKNKGKCLMEWMVFCRHSMVCNANSA